MSSVGTKKSKKPVSTPVNAPAVRLIPVTMAFVLRSNDSRIVLGSAML
jgi:hypothetical protein